MSEQPSTETKLYRKTALVPARQWNGENFPADIPIADALRILCDIHKPDGGKFIGYVNTREGRCQIVEGDYLCGPGAAGEYWPVGRKIFEATYEPASSPEPAAEQRRYIHRLETALRSIATNTCCGPCREGGLVAFEALHGKQPETKPARDR